MIQSLYPTASEISDAMREFRNARIGILGDFCIDAYWELAPESSEISIETGKAVQRVISQRYSPGGAGNVVVNLLALGVTNIKVFGVIGDDLYGRELVREMNQLGVDANGLIVQSSEWTTPVYGKPFVDGVEQRRMDFGQSNVLLPLLWESLTNCLCENRDTLDFLIVNQQLQHGWCSEENALWMSHELSNHWCGRHIVDARGFVRYFAQNALKVNEREAAVVLDRSLPDSQLDDDEARALLAGLMKNTGEAQYVTRGDRGIIAGAGHAMHSIPGVAINGPVDPVGAGDTSTAMLAACGAVKLDLHTSAILANLAASVTVSKLKQTGAACEAELLGATRHLAYIYSPALSEDLRLAQVLDDSDIEIVEGSMVSASMPASLPFRYAIFDHDGTISTLRQGWETVMESVMIRVITGNQYRTVDSSIIRTVTDRVRSFIEQTTGIQTIAQMDGLINLVQEFDLVPPEEQLDAWGYKQLYNDALMAMINERIRRLDHNELESEDFIIKGSLEFLRSLRDEGVSLCLFSGTDEADVIREAELLGYAQFFNEGIFGAKPHSRTDTKDEILTSLLINHSDALHGKVLVVGDGPVELRLARRYGAVALGIASNEQRRFGLNISKRRRLIRAGAHLIAPDFSQTRALCDALRRFKQAVPANQPQ